MLEVVQVREARTEDREVLDRLHRSLYVEHRDQVVDPRDLPLLEYRDYERVLADDLTALMSDKSAVVLVAESGGSVVGYVTGRVVVEPQRVLPMRGVLEDWYVAERERGKGVGRALFAELQQRFADRGCEVIESATWAGNDAARRVHESLGFRETRVVYRKRPQRR